MDVVDAVEDLPDDAQAAHPSGQVDLRRVAGDDHARAEAQPGEEHLHLLGSGVLRLIEHHERIVQRAPAHVGERRDLDRAARHELRNDLRIHHLVDRVVQRSQIRVDLVGEGARQEPEPLSRLDRRSREDDAADLAALQGLHGLRHRQVGLARSRRSDAEHDRVQIDRVDIVALTDRLGADHLSARGEDRLAERRARTLARRAEHAVRRRHVGGLDRETVAGHLEQLVDEHARRAHRALLARERDLVAAHEHIDARVLLLDDAQQTILRAEQLHHRDAVGRDRDGGGGRIVSQRGSFPGGLRRAHGRARGTRSDRRPRRC